MQITSVLAGTFKLDGGAMFGIVPRVMWERINPPDDRNLCTWAMRCLLVRTGDRVILMDTGIGEKQDARFRSHFHPSVPQVLGESLLSESVRPEEVTDVLLTHLHFDHVGGAVYLDEQGKPRLRFPNATHWLSERQWRWATENPNPREAASFLSENLLPLKDLARLEYLDPDNRHTDLEWLPGIRLRSLFGHTENMLMPVFELENGGRAAYLADLMPSAGHVGLPYVMSYDIRPLDSIDEKERLLDEALREDWLLYFEHDPVNTSGRLTKDERNRIVFGELYR